MEDPKTIKELNELIRMADMAYLNTPTKIRFFNAMRARLIKAGRNNLAKIVQAKSEEYKRLARKSRKVL